MATGQDIVDEVRAQLNDEDTTNYRWSDAEMLTFVNASQRTIVQLVPEANIVETEVEITDREVRRSLPAGGIKFIGAWNSDHTAGARGPALIPVEMDALNSFHPDWSYPDADVSYPTLGTKHSIPMFEHVVHNPDEPDIFYVYPVPVIAVSNPWIYVRYSANPTALASLASTFDLNDEYLNGSVQYVTYRCLIKDGRYGLGTERRQELWNNFRTALGLKPQIEARVDPLGGRAGRDENG